jgi:hypothetical protein
MGLASTLKTLSPSLYRLRIVSATTLVLLVPFLVYYFFFVRSQNAYFTDRSFRSLSLIGQQVTLKVESAGDVIQTASERFVNPERDLQTATKFDPAGDEKTNLAKLQTVFNNLKDGGPEIAPISVQVGTESQTNKLVTITGVREENGDPWLLLNYESRPTNEKKVVVVKARTNLRKLLQPLLDRRDNRVDSAGDEFEDILLADAVSGRVLFQLEQTGLRVSSVDKLSSAEGDQKKTDVKEIALSTNVTDIKLAGSSFKLFFNPLVLSLFTTNTNNVDNTSWIVCGLISTERFREETWSVSYTLLILFAFITALLVLHWPFMKLVLIGPKDRLRTADIYFLTFSTIVVLAIFTTFGLYGYSYLTISGQLDDQLQKLSGKIKQNFKEELTQALHQLNNLASNRNLLVTLKQEELNGKLSGETTTINCKQTTGNEFYQNAQTDRSNILPCLMATQDHPYPYFDTVSWIDHSGQQQAKWTIKAATTKYIDAKGRGYFKDLRNDDSRELDGVRFALEPIISKTTGRNEVEISIKTPGDDWITAFDTRLISLMQPVLPSGFGYLIVNKDGTVLFHSNELHHLGENFAKECDDSPQLRSAILSRNGRPLDVRYLGQDHRIVVTPFDGFPDWSLIVFRNKQTLRSAFLELVSVVSLLFLAYAFVLMFALSLFYLVNFNNDRRAWLWPSRMKTNVYYQSFLEIFLLSIISIPLILFLHKQLLVIVSALVSFFAIFIFFLHLRSNSGGLVSRLFLLLPNGAKRLWHYQLAYSLNLATLLLVVAILPAIAFYKFAFEAEMELFVKHGQFTLASSLAERDQRIRAQYADIVSGDVATAFIQERTALKWDIYDDFFFQTQHPQITDPTRCESKLAQQQLFKLTQYLPLYNQTSIERRGLLLNSSASGVCQWETSPSGELIMHLEGAAARDVSWHHLQTVVPPLGVPGPAWSALFVLTLIPFFLWILFIVRKVFLLDIHRPSSKPLRVLLQNLPTRNLFIVRDAPFTEASIANAKGVHVIDVATTLGAPNWASSISQPSEKEFHTVAVENFSHKLEDSEANHQRLVLLENLMTWKQGIMVLSDVEPSLYRFSNGDIAGQDNGNDEAARWAGIMSKFFKEYAEDSADSLPFLEHLKKKEEVVLAELTDAPEEKRTLVRNLFEIVSKECANRPALQDIGLNIVDDPHFSSLTPDHLLNRIVSQAQPYYNDIWDTCTLDEKLTLFHLAQDRLLSHRDPDIETLLRRGLILRDDDVYIMNESFRMFVRSLEQTTVWSEHEKRVKQGSYWNTLKVPFLIVLVAITLFLFVTQRDLYTSALAGLTAVTTIIPALFKVFSVFQSESVPHSGGASQSAPAK